MKVRVAGGAYLLVLKQNHICCFVVFERLRPQAISVWQIRSCGCIDRIGPDGKQSIVFGDGTKTMGYVGDLVNANMIAMFNETGLSKEIKV